MDEGVAPMTGTRLPMTGTRLPMTGERLPMVDSNRNIFINPYLSTI